MSQRITGAAALGIAVLAGAASLPAEPWRDLVEAEWRRHDEERLREIREPGTVRFAEAEIRWQGVQAGPTVSPRLASDWQIHWPKEPEPACGRNRLVLEVRAPGALDPPVEVAVETTVFTRRRSESRAFAGQTTRLPGRIDLEFEIAAEGAGVVTVSARRGEETWRESRAFFVPPLRETLDRGLRLLEEFRREPSDALAGLCARADALAARERAEGPDPAARAALCREARWAAREIALAKPLLDFDRLLFVKRFTQQSYPDVCLNHMPWVSRPGGDICILSPLRPDGAVRPLLGGALGPGHVHGADLSWDGTRIVFGYARAKSDSPPAGWLDRAKSYELRRSEEPIHIFEIGIDGRNLRQITRGEWSDLDPTYLADGSIVFVSERCGYSLQCNELDKDETSCNLYIVRPDGTGLHRLSVTKDGDYLPHALDDGAIAYTRWEYHERSWAHIQSIWTIRPDGTGADAVYKQHMNDPWALEDTRSIPGSRKLVSVATGHHTLPAGAVVVVDAARGLNNPDGLRIVTPGIEPPEGGMTGRAVAEGGVRGRGGAYMQPFALSENHFLVSYAHGGMSDEKGYALYLIDVFGTRELLYRDPEISSFQPIPARARPLPPVLADSTLPEEEFAYCVVTNVDEGVEGLDPGRIRFLRISEPVAWPYEIERGGLRYEPDVKSVMINWNPVRVLGTVPVEADGSAYFRVPADTAVYFQALDENHMELVRMRSFISFQPGEVRSCAGCHETRARAPAAEARPASLLALRREPSVPVPPPWGDRVISLLRDVQPVFDRHCASCHAGLEPAGGLDFSGGLTEKHNRAYDTILAARLVARSNVGDDARVTRPLSFGSHRSKLIESIRGSHRDLVKLGEEDWLRLVTWIDANAPYHDGFIDKRAGTPRYDPAADRARLVEIAAVHARRCAPCHEAQAVSRLDWIDLRAPERSRFLAAPLARAAGGEPRCPEPVYASAADPDYEAVLGIAAAMARMARESPRRDMAP